MLLEALVACAGVTLNAVATALGITLRDAVIEAEGTADFRGSSPPRCAPIRILELASFGLEGTRLTSDLVRLTGPGNGRKGNRVLTDTLERHAAPPNADTEILARVSDLYRAARYMDAYAAGASLGAWSDWPTVAGLALGGSLARNLGADRQARAMFLRRARAYPDHPLAQLLRLYALEQSRGPWIAWQFLRDHGIPNDDDVIPALVVAELRGGRADWLAMEARLLSRFRDFAAADRAIAAALEVGGERPWIHVEHAGVLEAEDRYPHALEACQRALAIRPGYRPAVQFEAHLLLLLDRLDEALTLLEATAPQMQCGGIWWQIAGLYREAGRHDCEHDALQRARALLPMMDKEMRAHMAARLSDTAYLRGDRQLAVTLARDANQPFFDKIARHIARDNADAGRKLLNLPFVRQNHQTCAPATLSAIARFWGRQADHLEIAEAICYDGTPWHSERAWAEQQGYVVREFEVTFECVASLIDRGLPFTLTTEEATNAHLQAVIGYDQLRRTLLIRDPYVPFVTEMLADALHERYASTGPRGLLLVPAEDAAVLENLELLDTELYDANHALNQALLRHDRQAAAGILAATALEHAQHPRVQNMRAALAAYDGDAPTHLNAVEDLLNRFPRSQPLLMRRFNLLMELDRREEAIAHLEQVLTLPDADPSFSERLADVLSEDARNRTRVRQILYGLLRSRSMAASLYFILGKIEWDEPARRDDAIYLYRFAAMLDDKNELYASAFFTAQQHARRTAEALQILERRARQYGHKSAGPTITHFDALYRTGRLPEAFQALRDGMERRPDDGELLLTAAVELARHGMVNEARTLVQRAEACGLRGRWLQSAALIDEYDGRLEDALHRWEQLVDLEPLNVEARRRIAQVIAELVGIDAAISHLRQASDRFPYFAAFGELLYHRLRDHDPEEAERVLRRVLELTPNKAWAVRELAFHLLKQRRPEEAQSLFQRAVALEPKSPAACHLEAELALVRGDTDACRAAYRKAIVFNADNDYAIDRLFTTCDTQAQARAEADFIAQEFARQRLFGNEIQAFQAAASRHLPAEDVLSVLLRCHEFRPDLWQAWTALIDQHLLLNGVDDADALSSSALERFPLHAPVWFTRAEVCRIRVDHEGQRDALREALRLSPCYGAAVYALADAHAADGDFESGIAVVDDALRRDPRNAQLQGWRAHFLWMADRAGDALQAATHALELDPGASWLWPRFHAWCKRQGCEQDAMALAERLVAQRPGEAALWYTLADLLRESKHLARCLEALDKAIELNGRFVDAHDLRAVLLADSHRYDEALAACRPVAFGEQVPASLLGRAAWVFAQMGKLDEAVARMQQVVADAPNYYWGWLQLAEWASSRNDSDQYRHVAQRLLELDPHDAHALMHAGRAMELEADAAAKAADRVTALRRAVDYYQRAFDLNPGHVWCGERLIHLLLDDAQHDQARQVLIRLTPQIYPEYALAYEVEIEAAAGGLEAALDAALRVIGNVDADSAAVERVFQGLERRVPWVGRNRVGRALGRMVLTPQSHLAAGAALVGWLMGRKCYRKAKRVLTRLRCRPEAWRLAATTYLEHLHDRCRHEQIWWFLVWHRRALADKSSADTDRLWGTAGMAAVGVGERRLTRRILGDWRERRHVEPWMLMNLIDALAKPGRFGEVREVCEAALQRPRDHTYPGVRLWQAVVAVVDRDIEAARQALADAPRDLLSDYHQFIFDCVDAAAAAGAEPHRSGGRRRGEDLLRAARQRRRLWWLDAVMRRVHRVAKARINAR